MAKKKSADKKIVIGISIAPLHSVESDVYIMGDGAFISHRWSVKAKLELLQKHMQLMTTRKPKDPWEAFLETIYRLDGTKGCYGFPSEAIKESMAEAATDIASVAKAEIFRNVGTSGKLGYQLAAFMDLRSPVELAELFSPQAPVIREDAVKLSGPARNPDLRYRAQFYPWALRFKLRYFPNFISGDSVMNLLHHAGQRVGIGEKRLNRGGTCGGFHIATAEEVKLIKKWETNGPIEPERPDVEGWIAELRQRELEESRERSDETARQIAENGHEEPAPPVRRKRRVVAADGDE